MELITLGRMFRALRRWSRTTRRSTDTVRARRPAVEYLEDRLCASGLVGVTTPSSGSGSSAPNALVAPNPTLTHIQPPSTPTTTNINAPVNTAPSPIGFNTHVVLAPSGPGAGTFATPTVTDVGTLDNGVLFIDDTGGLGYDSYQIDVVSMPADDSDFSATANGPSDSGHSQLPAVVSAVGAKEKASSVTPSVVLWSDSAGADDTANYMTRVFSVSRTPAENGSIEIPYNLRLYYGTTGVNQTGSIVLEDGVPGAGVRVEWGPLVRNEASAMAVLTLEAQPGYRLGRPAATMFAASANGYSEAALLHAFQKGQSPEAFAALVERHRDTVFQTCQRILGNGHDAEDVMQMVFLTLADRQVRLQVSLSKWLRVVARNAAIMALRARRRRAYYERVAALLESSSATDHRDLREELDAALSTVPRHLQQAVQLRYLEGCSQKEAAEIAGCPRGTLAQRAANGVRRLRDVLGDRGNMFS